MCFRPAESAVVPVCPSCGEKVPIMGGVVLKKCPHCGAAMGDDPAGSATSTPGAPKAPGAPGVPGAPQAPGAPKA